MNAWNRLHAKEVGSVDWNMVNKDQVAAASFDGSVSLINMTNGSIRKLHVSDTAPVYEAAWNPRDGNIIGAVSGDASIRIYDTRLGPEPTMIFPSAHAGEILCMDWNKYEPMQLATGSVDQQVKVWDLRSPSPTTPIQSFSGHYRAVRRVKYSPFHRNQLASTGYDMSVRVWDTASLNPASKPYTEHTEFVLGLSYSLRHPGLLASCSWDDSIHFQQVYK